MLIDWFTVAAQAVNFLILVWLLKRILYAPVLNAIAARENRIAAELADADAKKAEALTAREEFGRKNELFDAKRDELLRQATDEAETERQRLLDEVRRETDSLRTRQHEQLQNELKVLSEEVVSKMRAEVFAIARKMLTDLAGVSLETRMAEVFVERLRAFDAKERLAFDETPVLVRSAFELPQALRGTISGAIDELHEAKTRVHFEVVPELIGGIELVLSGQKIAWSVADHLLQLEKTALVQSALH